MPFDSSGTVPCDVTTDATAILTKAATLLRWRGRWIKGRLRRTVCFIPRYCLFGAVMRVSRSRPGSAGEQLAVFALDSAALVWGHANCVVFNDDPDTTHADVLALIGQAQQWVESRALYVS